MRSKDRPEFFKLSHDDRVTIKKIEILTSAVEKVYPSLPRLMLRSFIQGVFVALGSTVGFSIVILLLAFFVSQFKLIPVVGNFINQIQIQKVIPEK